MRLIDADALERKIMTMPDDELCEDCCYNVVNAIDSMPNIATDINVPNKWISVKDALPSEFSDCIVFADGYSQPAQYFEDGRFYMPDRYEEEKISGVTHWMPYPEGPKGSGSR